MQCLLSSSGPSALTCEQGLRLSVVSCQLPLAPLYRRQFIQFACVRDTNWDTSEGRKMENRESRLVVGCWLSRKSEVCGNQMDKWCRRRDAARNTTGVIRRSSLSLLALTLVFILSVASSSPRNSNWLPIHLQAETRHGGIAGHDWRGSFVPSRVWPRSCSPPWPSHSSMSVTTTNLPWVSNQFSN